MAPEFYFRPHKAPTGAPSSEPEHSYSQDAMFHLLSALKGLFVHKDFRDWLFVPGTILWNFPSPLQKGATVYFNTAVMVRGGAGKTKDTPLHYVQKRNVSPIDLGPVSDDGATRTKLNKELAILLKDYLGDWQERKQNLTTKFDNLCIGIEICLDHSQRVLQTVRETYGQLEGAKPVIHLHLLTACGMRLWPGQVAIDPGGYVLRVDGKTRAGLTQHETKRYSNAYVMTNEKDAAGVYNELRPLQPDEEIAIPQALRRSISVNDYPEQLVFYPPQPLPKPPLNFKWNLPK